MNEQTGFYVSSLALTAAPGPQGAREGGRRYRSPLEQLPDARPSGNDPTGEWLEA